MSEDREVYSDEKLLKCPFCGGKPGYAGSTQYDECFSVVCPNCGIIIGQYTQNDNGQWVNLFYKTKKAAAKAWNRRADDGEENI